MTTGGNVKSSNEARLRGALLQAIRLLDDGARPERIFGVLQNELKSLAPRSLKSTSSLPRSQGYYDRLLRELLAAARGSVSRDELLDKILNALEGPGWRGREIADPRAASFVLLLEGFRESDYSDLAQVIIRRVVGGQAQQVVNLQGAFAKRWETSGLVKRLLLEHTALDFVLSAFVDEEIYSGEFRELHGSRPVWVSGVPLPASSRGQPERAIIAIYEAIEDGITYELPRGGRQEWSLIEAVPDVYAILNHQLSTVGEQVAEQRRNLIMELAPNAIFHEVGVELSLIVESVARGMEAARLVSETIGPNPEFDTMLVEFMSIRSQAKRGRSIAHAFNNIEKRNISSVVSIKRMIEEVIIILESTLDKSNINIDTSAVRDFDVETDAALVEHVVLNVVHNAIDAIQSDEERNKRQRKNIWISARLVDNQKTVRLEIANDGPEIPPHLRAKMFQKGVTSKPFGVGHGQGLYICRLVANYLGGRFDYARLVPTSPAKVCFELLFPRQNQINDDILAL